VARLDSSLLHPGLAQLADPGAAPPDPQQALWLLAIAAVLALLAGACATVRRSMAMASDEKLRALAASPRSQRILERLLGRLDRLRIAFQLLEFAAGLGFALLLARALETKGAPTWGPHLLALALSVPVVWFATDALARALALRHGEALIARLLPLLHVAQMPLVALGWLFEQARAGLMRVLRLRDDGEAAREIVAGLREVIADAQVSGDLREDEREIIGNVMEIRDENVVALMTPRTAVQGVDAEAGVMAAARVMAASGHSRIPVYEGTLDKVIGIVSARDLVQLLAGGRIESADLRAIARPSYFVPETKRVSELLSEMRREKMTMAIVLDEYGGTAGLITMGDVLGELVGTVSDEFDADAPAPVRQLPDGAVEVDARLHVSEVNEALDLDLPEESDFETLGGFVLAELGRFPKRGEGFQRDGREYVVVEANDRRVLKVRVSRLAQAGAP
jgi:CBS domain containing-hemolysin-like protein